MANEYYRLFLRNPSTFDPNSYDYQNVVAMEAGYGKFSPHILLMAESSMYACALPIILSDQIV
jgi:hypothetical protein